MRPSRRIAVLAALVLSSCRVEPEPVSSPPTNQTVAPPASRPVPSHGATQFIVEEPDSYWGYDDMGMSEGDGASKTGSAPAAPNANPPSGRSGTVEEADIYRIDNNRLFYLNTYRGFIVYDLSDPRNPRELARLPVYGHPIEMFVTKTTVYALLRDALYVTRDGSPMRFKRHNVSQLVAIDISDASAPRVLKTVDVVGELREGVSRKIDDTIYVVSYVPQSYYYRGYPYGKARTEQAWVHSFNVADPKNVVLVEQLKIFEGGGYNSRDRQSSSSRWFAGVAISATANTLHVVENWYVHGWANGGPHQCSQYQSLQQAVVSIVDISDTTGKIRLHSRFETYGALTDQFKQTYVHDPATGRGTYLGIFARQEWSSQGCKGQMNIQNSLEAWDVTDGAHPVRVGQLSFGKPNETVRGTTFDPARKVAFAITARTIDPLYALSFVDPANLKILSAIDGLSGDMSLFRLIEGNKFLIGVGRDNSQTCTGFGDPTAQGWSTNVAVSVIDVQNLAKLRLVQRKCVTVKDAQWITSQVSWNLDQAHKLVGMHSDSRANVISVPVSYYSKADATDGWWYRYQSAVGLMTWNLSLYDPRKSELDQRVLASYGTVKHPEGQVRRSIVFTHQGATARRMMVNLSDTHVSVVDIDDLTAPRAQALVEVAPYHARLHRFGDYVVDEVRVGSGHDWSFMGSEFRVKRVGSGIDDAKPVATFTVGQVYQALRWKNDLVLVRSVQTDGGRYGYYGSSQSELVVFDLSDPTRPFRKGSVLVPAIGFPYYWFWCGNWDGFWSPWWGESSGLAATDRGIAFMSWSYEYPASGYSYAQKLVFVDLTNSEKPQVQEQVLTSYSSNRPRTLQGIQYVGLTGDPSDGSGLYLTFKWRLGERVVSPSSNSKLKLGQYAYYAQRFTHTAGGLAAESAINVPGSLLRTWKEGATRYFLANDRQYDVASYRAGGASGGKGTERTYHYWRGEPRLHLLEGGTGLFGDVAELKDSLELPGREIRGLTGDSSKLFLSLSSSYSPQGVVTEEETMDRLAILDISAGRLDKAFEGVLGTWGVQLMGTHESSLFVNMPGDGILVVDASDLKRPFGKRFVRTLGYATHIEFAKDTAYVAAGNFGIHEIDLTAAPLLEN